MFLGFVPLEGFVPVAVLVRAAGSPVNADGLPGYRVYGPLGVMPNGTGSLPFLDAKPVAGASAAAPVVVTSTAHGLSTGTRVTVAGALGMTGLNGTWGVTVIDLDHFSLNASSGSGTYGGSGVWNVTGLYGASLGVSAANGYAPGFTYLVLVEGTVGGAGWGEVASFCCV